MPALGLLAMPLYTKRLCHVPLAEALLKPGRMAPGQVRGECSLGLDPACVPQLQGAAK
jgi:hypothetical protein